MAPVRQLRAAGISRVRPVGDAGGTGVAGGRTLGAGHPVEGRAIRLRATGPAEIDRTRAAPADRGRRPVDLLEDEPGVHRAPAGADGLHRGAARGAGRVADRRGPPAGAVHVEGLHGAGLEDAAPVAQARAGAGRRGSVRGIPRLQGGDRALRVVPEGRALRRVHGGATRPGRRPPAGAEAAGHPRPGASGPLRPQRLRGGGAAARPVQRRAAQAAAGAVPGAVRRDHDRLPPVAG